MAKPESSTSGSSHVLAWLDNDDLNGECFITGEIGEIEEKLNNRLVHFPPGMDGTPTPGVGVKYSNDQMGEFLMLNAHMSHQADVAGTQLGKKHMYISYMRFLAARSGLIAPGFSRSEHHVRYNEAVSMPRAAYNAMTDELKPENFPADLLPAADRKLLRANFANIVCCIAYMFRVRGHHWLEDMDQKYRALWQRCIKGGDFPLLEWKFLAHDALHAIMPDVLDNYWQSCVRDGSIAGALAKRLDSAPAGVAAIRAVYSGAQDLQMAVPGIRSKFREHFDDLEDIMADLRVNRWNGSINRRYYGAGAVAFDEQKFGAIASVVWSALQAFAASSPLLKSKALERVANNAPITGGIISRSIATAASNPKVVEKLFVADDQ